MEKINKTLSVGEYGTFGQAIESIKKGMLVTRKGWNNSSFIYYIPSNTYHSSGNKLGTLNGLFENDMVPYSSYVSKKENDIVTPYIASNLDILSEDWMLFNF